MEQSKSKSLRQVDSKQRFNTPKGRFVNILNQRKSNLAEQKAKLELAKLELQAHQAELDEEMQKLKGQQELIKELHNDFKSLDSSLSIHTDDDEVQPTALREQKTLLQKTEADLMQQLKIAQRQLEHSSNQLQESTQLNNNPELIKSVEAKFKEKTIQVQMLRELLKILRNEVLTRENDVIALEIEALQHKKEINKAIEQRENLYRRRKEAEKAKRDLIIEIKKCDQMKHEFSKKKKKYENELQYLKAEKDNLDVFEKELIEKEESLKTKKEQIEQMKSDFLKIASNKIQERIQSEAGILQKAENIIKSTPADKQADEIFNMENKLDLDEKIIDQRLSNLQIEKEMQLKTWEEKKQKLNEMIVSLQASINEFQPQDEMSSTIAKQTEENDQIQAQISSIEEEINKIQSQLLSQEEIDRLNSEYLSESKALLKQDRELNSKLSQLKVEEENIQSEEEDLQVKFSSFEAEKAFIQNNNKANEQMLSMTGKQLELAKKRYENEYKRHLMNENA